MSQKRPSAEISISGLVGSGQGFYIAALSETAAQEPCARSGDVFVRKVGLTIGTWKASILDLERRALSNATSPYTESSLDVDLQRSFATQRRISMFAALSSRGSYKQAISGKEAAEGIRGSAWMQRSLQISLLRPLSFGYAYQWLSAVEGRCKLAQPESDAIPKLVGTSCGILIYGCCWSMGANRVPALT